MTFKSLIFIGAGVVKFTIANAAHEDLLHVCRIIGPNDIAEPQCFETLQSDKKTEQWNNQTGKMELKYTYSHCYDKNGRLKQDMCGLCKRHAISSFKNLLKQEPEDAKISFTELTREIVVQNDNKRIAMNVDNILALHRYENEDYLQKKEIDLQLQVELNHKIIIQFFEQQLQEQSMSFIIRGEITKQVNEVKKKTYGEFILTVKQGDAAYLKLIDIQCDANGLARRTKLPPKDMGRARKINRKCVDHAARVNYGYLTEEDKNNAKDPQFKVSEDNDIVIITKNKKGEKRQNIVGNLMQMKCREETDVVLAYTVNGFFSKTHVLFKVNNIYAEMGADNGESITYTVDGEMFEGKKPGQNATLVFSVAIRDDLDLKVTNHSENKSTSVQFSAAVKVTQVTEEKTQEGRYANEADELYKSNNGYLSHRVKGLINVLKLKDPCTVQQMARGLTPEHIEEETKRAEELAIHVAETVARQREREVRQAELQAQLDLEKQERLNREKQQRLDLDEETLRKARNASNMKEQQPTAFSKKMDEKRCRESDLMIAVQKHHKKTKNNTGRRLLKSMML